MFSVTAYEGDYQMSNQPNWGNDWPSFAEAISEALKRFDWIRSKHTLTPEKEFCVVVYDTDADPDGVRAPAFVVGSPGAQLGCHWD